jgi:cyclic pyranopterin phosphate synthase
MLSLAAWKVFNRRHLYRCAEHFMSNILQDRHNRVISYLRISITDRCNFRCTYCLPADGVEWLPHDEVLSYEEIARVAQVGSTLGLSKIRITGGEPTVRKDLPKLIAMLRAISGIEEISLTTNVARLGVLAAPLKAAGLDRVNISLDTLQREKMKTISRRDFYDDVMAGIEAAIQNDFAPLKFNCVAMRGVNDDEFCDLLDFANERDAQMRFIEYMPMGAARFSTQSKFISAEEMREILSARFDLQPEYSQSKNDPAKVWRCGKTGARVGFITSISENFCDSCNRMRLTAEGGLRPCLHQNAEVGVKEILRSGGDDAAIVQAFRDAANLKWAGHHMNDFVPVFSDKEMISIGG